MRKKPTPCLSQSRSWLMLCVVLLLAACGNGSGDSLKDASPAIGNASPGQQASSPASISPFDNLTNGALIAPEQPTLSVTAHTGALNFQWQAAARQIRARLYLHDPLLSSETLTHEFEDPTAASWTLPSQTQARPWHRQRYRVELCTVDDCVSSPRVPLEELAPNTVDILNPAVFIAGERYADQIALSDTAIVAVITLPVEGALEFRARSNDQWNLIQRLRLDDLTVSTTRTLDVALSDSGDTLAVFVRDSANPTACEIRVLERLGEAWIETAAWSVSDTMAADAPVMAETPDALNTPFTGITLSADGKQVLLHSEQSLVIYRQTQTQWLKTPFTLNHGNAQEPQPPGMPAWLLASSQNAELTRVFTLVVENQQLYLGVWTSSSDVMTWQRRAFFPVEGPDPEAPLSIISNTEGSSVVLAGWENTNTQKRSPVMWRYRVETAHASTPADPFSLGLTDSLRAPPTALANPDLVFAADGSLTLVALGWQTADDPASTSATLPESALSTYAFDSQTRQWLSALELPRHLPSLAGQSFASEIVLSADGSTMMMNTATGNTASPGAHVGQVWVMR